MEQLGKTMHEKILSLLVWSRRQDGSCMAHDDTGWQWRRNLCPFLQLKVLEDSGCPDLGEGVERSDLNT